MGLKIAPLPPWNCFPCLSREKSFPKSGYNFFCVKKRKLRCQSRHRITLALHSLCGWRNYCARRCTFSAKIIRLEAVNLSHVVTVTGLDSNGRWLTVSKNMTDDEFLFFNLLCRKYRSVQKQTLRIFKILPCPNKRAWLKSVTHCHFCRDKETPCMSPVICYGSSEPHINRHDRIKE